MIIYDRLWKTMEQKGISQYYLIEHCDFSTSQLDRFRKNSNITMNTLDKLCRALDCKVEDIIEYRKED